MAPILEVRNLKTTFKQSRSSITVVDGVNFTLEPGETLGIVGESGCGKSVTSLSIMRLLGKNAVTDGTIAFEGKNLLELSEKEMKKVRGNRVAMIFQEPMTSLNPLHSVGKQISEPLRNHLGLSKAQAKEKTIQLLKAVGIPRADEIFSSYPHQLSGGMRQRVMIAMAMACQPKLIIADEPTTALDVTIQAQILELMKKLKKENGTSIVMITHDLGVVAEMCERVIVMYAGQVVEEADIRSLFRSPKHPYTIGLMKSMPDFAEDQDRLQAIPGTVPLLSDLPKCCRFAPRCEWATDRCHQTAPEFISVTEQHRVRCVLVEEEKV
ncbi:ABC transporter ATP-binding protein [Ammoniphilus sp. YIM 78166]|uniref:ABC transporter ATP-binding protein n=1 Tax=Ammoniphilus sp. YIM 78166 TaxID=1644106 RepID=UPI0010701FD2|nr:ABC transporter ATP-binding protein [Ammoniphilus sp. YIM 78166]